MIKHLNNGLAKYNKHKPIKISININYFSPNLSNKNKDLKIKVKINKAPKTVNIYVSISTRLASDVSDKIPK